MKWLIHWKKKKFLQSITSKASLEEFFENFRQQEGRPTKISEMTLEQLNEEMKMISYLINLAKEIKSEKRKTNIIAWLNQITDTIQQKRSEEETQQSQETGGRRIRVSTSETKTKKKNLKSQDR